MTYISGFQVLLLEKFQMAIGTRAGMWERKQSTKWWDHSSEPEGSTPHTCSSRARSPRKACSQLSPPAFPPALLVSPFISSTLQRAASHPGETRRKAVKSKERKGWVWAAQPAHCSASCPLPWHPTPATPVQTPREDPGGSWQKSSEWRNNIAPSYVASPLHKEEGAIQIPPLTIPSGCTIPQRLWHKGSQRDQTTFLTVTNNKTNLQWVVWLNLKATVLFMHLLTKTLLKHKQIAQLHACTFALTTGKYKLAAVSSFWRGTKVTLWVKELDHPPLPLL